MKYCSKCGQQLEDNAVYCIGCGRLVSDPNQPFQPYQTPSNQQPYKQSTFSTAAYVFMIIGTVLNALFSFGISLAWCLPMTISYSKKIHNGIKVETGFKVCALLFVSLLGGILMLCDNNNS